ncbi:hypothetical protein [Sorangium sp. So ce1335]|uniref:hypothetical protein n=1 Tax=Sorangium sp. So ce1335 TaxID=3133335 RepID=UPI003F616597
MSDKVLTVDLANASDDDLNKIKNSIVARLAERAKLGSIAADGYDRHGSGHSRASPSRIEGALEKVKLPQTP